MIHWLMGQSKKIKLHATFFLIILVPFFKVLLYYMDNIIWIVTNLIL